MTTLGRPGHRAHRRYSGRRSPKAFNISLFQELQRRTLSPIWQNLNDDPRWEEYLEFDGMYPARLDAIEYDPDLPE